MKVMLLLLLIALVVLLILMAFYFRNHTYLNTLMKISEEKVRLQNEIKSTEALIDAKSSSLKDEAYLAELKQELHEVEETERQMKEEINGN